MGRSTTGVAIFQSVTGTYRETGRSAAEPIGLGQFRRWSADLLAQRPLELSAASEFQCRHACLSLRCRSLWACGLR